MSPTHVVVVKFGVVPKQPFAFSSLDGAMKLAQDARSLGYRDAKVVPIDQYQSDRRNRSGDSNRG